VIGKGVNHVVGTDPRNMPPIARFERATYALEEFVAAGMCTYFNDLDA
jgi:hypothetical protein